MDLATFQSMGSRYENELKSCLYLLRKFNWWVITFKQEAPGPDDNIGDQYQRFKEEIFQFSIISSRDLPSYQQLLSLLLLFLTEFQADKVKYIPTSVT